MKVCLDGPETSLDLASHSSSALFFLCPFYFNHTVSLFELLFRIQGLLKYCSFCINYVPKVKFPY